MKKTILTLAAACSALATANAQTTLFDFETSSQLTMENRTGGGLATEQGTGGLSDSAYITPADFSGSQFTAIAQNSFSADLSSDQTITQSVYFKTAATQSSFPTNGQDAVVLGISDSSTQTPTNENLISSGLTDNYLATSIRVSNTDNGGNVDLRFHGFTTGDIAPFGPAGNATVTVAANAWYFFEVDYAYESAGDQWRFTYRLSSSDSIGNIATPADLFELTLNGAVRGNDFGSSPDLYGFLAGDASRSSRILGFDNATLVGSAIPEPSSYALIAGALALGLIVIRRRS